MLSTRDPSQNKGHIQTKSEGLEKNISCKRRPKDFLKKEKKPMETFSISPYFSLKQIQEGHK